MWQSGCCSFIALVLVFVSVGFNEIFTQTGQTPGRVIEPINIDVIWQWQQVDLTIVSGIGENTTITEGYDDAWEDLCDENGEMVDVEICNDLLGIDIGGSAFMGLNVVSMVCLFFSLLVAVLVTFGKCICNCRAKVYRRCAIVSLMTSLFSLIASLIVFHSMYKTSLNDFLNYITPFHGKTIEWSDLNIGKSVKLSIASCVCCFLSIIVLCCFTKQKDRTNQQSQQQQTDALINNPRNINNNSHNNNSYDQKSLIQNDYNNHNSNNNHNFNNEGYYPQTYNQPQQQQQQQSYYHNNTNYPYSNQTQGYNYGQAAAAAAPMGYDSNPRQIQNVTAQNEGAPPPPYAPHYN